MKTNSAAVEGGTTRHRRGQRAEVAAAPQRSMTRLRFTVFDALCNAKGLDNDQQRARALEISHPHLSRMRAGECGAGRKVISKALQMFPPIGYHDLFEEVAR